MCKQAECQCLMKTGQERKLNPPPQWKVNVKVASNSATPWTVACQAPQPVEFSRQEAGVGCHALLQGIPDPGIGPTSSALQADSLPFELPRTPLESRWNIHQAPSHFKLWGNSGGGAGGRKREKEVPLGIQVLGFFFFFVEFLVGRVKGKFNREGTQRYL